MVLNNVKIVGDREPVNISIGNGKITGISSSFLADKSDSLQLSFNDAIAFPGLINSHDHLDFNLFPSFGDSKYNNYTEWGKRLHENYKAPIAEVLKIPTSLRSQWGLYKNLLGGVTTVVNHGEKLVIDTNIITVFDEAHYLHSVKFQKYWRIKLNNPFKRKIPVNIHVGEGHDYSAFDEINQLIRWNLLGRKLIGVHAVAMTENQAKKFKAIIWCPESNYFLLNKTAAINLLQKHTKLLFGTDSTLTGSWDIWKHLQLARRTSLLEDKDLYETLNKNAAEIWQLNSGMIAAGKDADIVIANGKTTGTGYSAFFGISPADLLLVTHKGKIRLFDETISAEINNVDFANFSKVYIGTACKYIFGDLPGLIEKIKEYNPLVPFPISLTKPD